MWIVKDDRGEFSAAFGFVQQVGYAHALQFLAIGLVAHGRSPTNAADELSDSTQRSSSSLRPYPLARRPSITGPKTATSAARSGIGIAPRGPITNEGSLTAESHGHSVCPDSN